MLNFNGVSVPAVSPLQPADIRAKVSCDGNDDDEDDDGGGGNGGDGEEGKKT